MKAKSRKRTGRSARKSKPADGHANTSPAAADRDPLHPPPPRSNPVMLLLSVLAFVVWFGYLLYVALAG